MIKWLAASYLILLSCGPALGGPEDHLMVVVLATGNGQDQVSFTYPGHVPAHQAREDLHRLLKATGWQAEGVKVSDGVGPGSRPGTPPMTSVEFSSLWAVIPATGTFRAAPIVQAFARYRHVGMLFLVPPGFRYLGPPAYEDQDVSLALDAHPGSYLFHATIKRQPVRSFQLPPALPRPRAAAPRPAREDAGAVRGSPAVRVLVVVLLAAGAGAVVYSLSNWWAATRSRETLR